MSLGSIATGPLFAIPRFPVRRFSVHDYQRLIQAGILTEDDPVELLDGWIVQKMPRNPRHDATIDHVREVLQALVPAGMRVRVQSAITTADSEPEPDLAIVPGPAGRYQSQHPGPGSVALVIEVADSSLARDRDEKGPLYARAGIPIYWIINLADERIETYCQPGDTGYQQRQDFSRGAAVPLLIEAKEMARIAVEDLLIPAAV